MRVEVQKTYHANMVLENCLTPARAVSGQLRATISHPTSGNGSLLLQFSS